MTNQVNKAIERVMYTHDGVEPPVSCPRCGQALVQDTGPYLVATRRDWRLTDNFMAAGDFGYLCAGCDTAVIHTSELAMMLYGGPSRSGWNVGQEFAVLGLINLDAVPPEKAHIPIPDLDPLPLARFHSRRSKEFRSAVRKKRPRKPKPKRKR